MATVKRTTTLAALIGLGALLLTASGAGAQQRPTLEGLTQAICEKADADGDSYRPKVCQARCDCFTNGLPGAVVNATSCMETSPGDFEIEAALLQHLACDPTYGICGAPATCTVTADCVAAGFPGTACGTGPFANICIGGSCSSNLDCAQYPIAGPTVTLSLVAPITDPGPATCAIDNGPTYSINTHDANECLEQIAAAGIDCGFRCGNGIVDTAQGETCDDGNETPGDGCDASCQTEP